MKGIVLSFPGLDRSKTSGRLRLSYFKYYIKRYGVRTAFVLALLTGLALGAVYAADSDIEMLKSLDFLFTTNLEARMSNGFMNTFCACFASDFVFLFAVFLLGFAPWGVPFAFAAALFKGFGTGITAGYLCVFGSLSGAGFYLLVLLPGTFLFCAALVMFSYHAFCFSNRLFWLLACNHTPAQSMRPSVIAYCSHFLSALIATFFAAVLDTALWTFFAGAFNF